MKDMLNDMNNDMVCIEHYSRAVLNDNENGMDYCVLMHWGIPFTLHDSTDALRGRKTIIMSNLMLSWRLLVLTGVRPK